MSQVKIRHCMRRLGRLNHGFRPPNVRRYTSFRIGGGGGGRSATLASYISTSDPGTYNCDCDRDRSLKNHSQKIRTDAADVKRFQSTSTSTGSRSGMETEMNMEMDFMGEPVMFIGGSEAPTKPASQGGNTTPTTSSDSLLALDAYLIQILSRGQTLSEGGDEFGIAVKAAHSSAIVWAELIRHVSFWSHYDNNNDNGNGNGEKREIVCDAPMLAAAAFSPLLISGGVSYVANLDDNYLRSSSSSDEASSAASLPFLVLCRAAASRKNDGNHLLSIRERYHLWALDYLLHNEHSRALDVYCQLLQTCPGDALGLSLALDLANVLGAKHSIFQAATSVAAYWNERGQRGGMMSGGQTGGGAGTEGHSIGSALIANGFAIGGRTREAEQLADQAAFLDRSGASGVVTWAKAHIFDAEGRVSEGTSAFTGDGVENYVSCGFLFFDARMAGLGSRFVMDRSGSYADRKALRLYDENFGRIIEYSGYGEDLALPIIRRIPLFQRDILVNSTGDAVSSMFKGLFGGSKEDTNKRSQSPDEKGGDDDNDDDDSFNSLIDPSEPRNLENVLTWLPPTSEILTDATFLLLRLVISGAVQADDDRWKKLQAAWEKMANIENAYSGDIGVLDDDGDGDGALFSHSPMARLAASFFIEVDDEKNMENAPTLTTSGKIQKAARITGHLLSIDSDEDGESVKKQWVNVVRLLIEARSGWEKESDAQSMGIIRYPSRPLVQDLEGWDLMLGNLTEHLICHAAIQSGDHDALNIARGLCSESVMLRTNSPESWHRYGVILENLGDMDNAQDAFHASVSLGSGEGGRPGAQ